MRRPRTCGKAGHGWGLSAGRSEPALAAERAPPLSPHLQRSPARRRQEPRPGPVSGALRPPYPARGRPAAGRGAAGGLLVDGGWDLGTKGGPPGGSSGRWRGLRVGEGGLPASPGAFTEPKATAAATSVPQGCFKEPGKTCCVGGVRWAQVSAVKQV